MAKGRNPNCYEGNPRLKAAYVSIEYTPEQVVELEKCMTDPFYFIANYVKIITLDKGAQEFGLWDYQIDLVQTYLENRFVVAKFPRQVGKTTTTVAYLLWKVLFNPTFSIAILANKLKTAKEIMDKFKASYERLPFFMQQGIKEWNQYGILLENDSKISVAATTLDAIRGFSYNVVLLDEFAMVNSALAEDFMASVFPTISQSEKAQILILSTPKGLNHFYKLWEEAIAGKNGFVPRSIHWSQVPGRDEVWEKSQREKLGDDKFNQEHNCFFIGSSNTLISAQALTSMVMQEPIYSTEELAIYHQPRRLDPHGDKDDPKNKDHAYVLTVDVSRGLGMDYSAFSVIDVTEFPYHQVARFKSNTVSPTMFPNFIYDAARQYNNAFVLIETNDIGQQVADILWQELEYECVIRTVTNGRSGQVISQGHKRNSKLGVKTSAPVKSIGCSTLKALIENKKLLIHDEDTFDELTKFVQIRNSYAAEPGTDNHDDLVMTLVLFGWLSSQQFFKDFTQSSLRSQLSEDYSKQMEESMLPFGFIDDGLSNANTFIDVHGETWTEVEVDRHLCDQDSFWNLDDQDITPEERMRNLQMLHAGWLSRNTPK